jgi:hypothetical protein
MCLFAIVCERDSDRVFPAHVLIDRPHDPGIWTGGRPVDDGHVDRFHCSGVYDLDNVKLRNAQNRLGYVVYLAKQVARRAEVREKLKVWEKELEDARLAKEDTLCRDSMPARERDWLRANRPEAAIHWNLLTGLTADQLSYAES